MTSKLNCIASQSWPCGWLSRRSSLVQDEGLVLASGLHHILILHC